MLLSAPPPTPLWRRALRVLAAGTIGGLLVSALGVGIRQGIEDEDLHVERVEIVGNHRATEVAIRHLAQVPTGAHLGSLDLDRVRQQVERHPWVAEAQVARLLPSTLRIEVREHQPVLLLALDQLWYVDAQGHPFKPADSQDLDYPVLTGVPRELVSTRPELAQATVQGALRLLEAVDDGPLRRDQLSELHFDDRMGYELVLRNGSRLRVGFDDPAPALERLERMLRHGLDLASPQEIDLVPQTVAIATPLPPIP